MHLRRFTFKFNIKRYSMSSLNAVLLLISVIIIGTERDILVAKKLTTV